MLKFVAVGVTLPFLVASAAAATAPKIAGAYAVNYNEICQTGNQSVDTPGYGATYSQILIVKFNAPTKKFTMTGSSVSGPLTGPNVSLKSTAVNESGSYSNTAATITIGATTYAAAFGPLDASGVAESLVFGGVSSGGCAASGTAIRKAF